MTPAIRTLPIVRAMRVARGWFVSLPAGNLFAESEAQVRSMVSRHAPGSAVMFLGQNPQRDAAEVAAVRKIRLSRAAAVRDGAAAANSSVRLARSADGRSVSTPQGTGQRLEDIHRLTEGPASRSGRSTAGPSTPARDALDLGVAIFDRPAPRSGRSDLAGSGEPRAETGTPQPGRLTVAPQELGTRAGPASPRRERREPGAHRAARGVGHLTGR